MKALGSLLKAIGGFSLVMTGLHLWRIGFPRFEGPEGESRAKVLISFDGSKKYVKVTKWLARDAIII